MYNVIFTLRKVNVLSLELDSFEGIAKRSCESGDVNIFDLRLLIRKWGTALILKLGSQILTNSDLTDEYLYHQYF